MKKTITVTNWDFKEVEFVLEVKTFGKDEICLIKASGPDHFKQVLCFPNELEANVSEMELECRTKYVKTSPGQTLKEMDFEVPNFTNADKIRQIISIGELRVSELEKTIEDFSNSVDPVEIQNSIKADCIRRGIEEILTQLKEVA